jgi:hypothetical protein
MQIPDPGQAGRMGYCCLCGFHARGILAPGTFPPLDHVILVRNWFLTCRATALTGGNYHEQTETMVNGVLVQTDSLDKSPGT